MRQCSRAGSQCTSTTRSSSCSFDVFILLSARTRTNSQFARAKGNEEADGPLPLVVSDVHYVVELIARHAAVVAAPDVELEDRLRLEVRHLGLPRRRREAEDELEVYRIF